MVITLEYQQIYSDHPLLVTMTPAQLRANIRGGHMQLGTLDFAFSFSSLEHDGLGRYGDPLDAYADVKSLAQLHCLLKPGGLLFLGVPIGEDALEMNASRVYGYRRLGLLLATGWRLLDVHFDLERTFRVEGTRGGDIQPVLVLEKLDLSMQ
ncbi:hypothetical protein B484DRAFT_443859 [Ochromonadaceae sp. CCMP2298]|nr:hypothetical protein B484DRAFT_443859 [Ochromonadaceae sp. CCMP2298]